MTLETLRTRSEDECLSDLQLDALALGALDETQAEQAQRHLAGCARCSQRRQALGEATRSSAELLARTRPRGSSVAHAVRAAGRSTRRVWRGGAVGAAGAAAAAAVLLLVIARAPLFSGADTVRSKGAGRVGYFVRHDGVVRRGGEREHVAPGDALRFVVTISAPSYVAVLSRDGAGQVSVYHPNGPRAARVEAGVERPLDASVVLDAVLGEEQLYALVCSAPVEVAAVSQRLRRADAEPAWPAECTIDRFVLVKEEAKR